MRRWLALAVTATLALGCERSRPRAVDAGARPAVVVRDVPPSPPPPIAEVDAGAPTEVDAGAARRVVVTACGDLPLSPSVFEAIRRGADGRLLTALGPVSPLLGEEAIAFGDLRGVLMARPTGGYTAGLENARALARLGFDALLLATDHALEGGVAGLSETLTAVRAAGVGVAGACEGGAGVCPPAVVERAGARVAFMGATARVAGRGADDPTSARVDRVGATNEALLAAVRDARAEADVLVFGLHVGRSPGAGDARRKLVDALIEAGADLVVIAGPERVGLVERRESPRGERRGGVVDGLAGELLRRGLSRGGDARDGGVEPVGLRRVDARRGGAARELRPVDAGAGAPHGPRRERGVGELRRGLQGGPGARPGGDARRGARAAAGRDGRRGAGAAVAAHSSPWSGCARP
ncbi:MAG: CapA family protein [Polyangiales bacterium]